MSSTRQSRDAEAVLMRKFKAAIDKACKVAEKLLICGLGASSDIEEFSHSMNSVNNSLSPLLKSTSTTSLGPGQLLRSTLPLAEACSKLENSFRVHLAGNGADPQATVSAAKAVSRVSCSYNFLILAFNDVQSIDLAFEDLKTLVRPFKMTTLATALTDKAWKDREKELEEASLGLDSDFSFIPDTVLDCLHLNFVSLEVGAILGTGPALSSFMDQLKAAGMDFLEPKHLWSLFDKLALILGPSFGIRKTILQGAVPLRYADTLKYLLVSSSTRSSQNEHSSALNSFFGSKAHTECLVLALEALAVSAIADRSPPTAPDERDWTQYAVDLGTALQNACQLYAKGDFASAGAQEAFKWALSSEVHSRVYNACKGIYFATVNCKDARTRLAGFMTVSRALSMWGVRWLCCENPSGIATNKFILKSDMLMIKSWMDMVQMIPECREKRLNCDLDRLSQWIRVYYEHAEKGNTDSALLADESWFLASGGGEMSQMKLKFDHLEVLLSIPTFLLDTAQKDASFRVHPWQFLGLRQAGESIDKLVTKVGMLPYHNEMRLKVFEYGKDAILAGLKSAKAVQKLHSKWGPEMSAGTGPDVHSVAAVFGAGYFNSLTIALHAFDMAGVLPEKCRKECSSFCLLALDGLASASEKTRSVAAFQDAFRPFVAIFCKLMDYLGKIVDSKTPGYRQLYDMLPRFELSFAATPSAPTLPGGRPAGIVGRERYVLIKRSLDKIMESALNPERAAVERATLLGQTLPCACLSCTAMKQFGKKSISSKRCSGCRTVSYCSVACQKKDWKLHKVACKAIAAAAVVAKEGSASAGGSST